MRPGLQSAPPGRTPLRRAGPDQCAAGAWAGQDRRLVRRAGSAQTRDSSDSGDRTHALPHWPVLGVIGGDLICARSTAAISSSAAARSPERRISPCSRPLPEVSRRAAAMAIRIVPEIAGSTSSEAGPGRRGHRPTAHWSSAPSESHPGFVSRLRFLRTRHQLGPAVGRCWPS